MTRRRFAYLFPGQGSQRPGMGRELADAFAECRAVFDAADAALDRPISRICFEGSAADLALTENTQPALLTVSVAALRALERRGLTPAAAAGHSLGEYAAQVCAGTIDFTDAVRTVQRRGRFMQDAVPVGVGAMAAILGLDPQRVVELCRTVGTDGVVAAANLNGPSQVVIAGHAAAVQRAGEAARDAGARRVVPLPVSAPFHCSLMEPAAERLRPVLREIHFRDGDLPVYTNVDAGPVRSGEAARDALERQVAAPVRWQESIEGMLADGIEIFVEVGPGKVLSGLVRGIRKGVTTYHTDDAATLEAVARELAA